MHPLLFQSAKRTNASHRGASITAAALPPAFTPGELAVINSYFGRKPVRPKFRATAILTTAILLASHLDWRLW
jgi:hypothetical protein